MSDFTTGEDVGYELVNIVADVAIADPSFHIGEASDYDIEDNRPELRQLLTEDSAYAKKDQDEWNFFQEYVSDVYLLALTVAKERDDTLRSANKFQNKFARLDYPGALEEIGLEGEFHKQYMEEMKDND